MRWNDATCDRERASLVVEYETGGLDENGDRDDSNGNGNDSDSDSDSDGDGSGNYQHSDPASSAREAHPRSEL